MAERFWAVGGLPGPVGQYYEEKENVDDEDKEMKEISKEEMDEFRNEKFS